MVGKCTEKCNNTIDGVRKCPFQSAYWLPRNEREGILLVGISKILQNIQTLDNDQILGSCIRVKHWWWNTLWRNVVSEKKVIFNQTFRRHLKAFYQGSFSFIFLSCNFDDQYWTPNVQKMFVHTHVGIHVYKNVPCRLLSVNRSMITLIYVPT